MNYWLHTFPPGKEESPNIFLVKMRDQSPVQGKPCTFMYLQVYHGVLPADKRAAKQELSQIESGKIYELAAKHLISPAKATKEEVQRAIVKVLEGTLDFHTDLKSQRQVLFIPVGTVPVNWRQYL